MAHASISIHSDKNEVLRSRIQSYSVPTVNNGETYWCLELGNHGSKVDLYIHNPNSLLEIKNAIEKAIQGSDYKLCPNCEELHWHEDFTDTAEEGKVCDNCIKDSYVTCDDCEQYFHENDVHHMQTGTYCGNCKDNNLTKEEIAEIKGDMDYHSRF
jgi:hypothetical protein